MKKTRLVPILMLALILAALPVFRSIAAEQTVSLTIRFVSGETALSGARFDIYYVAEFDPAAGYTLSPAFANDFSIEGYEDHVGWDALAQEMSDFADEHGVSPTETGYSDASGRVVFPGAGSPQLEEGLYLVVGHPVESSGSIYTCLPFLVLLPSWDEESSAWVYGVVASPKSGSVTPQPTPEPTEAPTPPPELTPSPNPDISPSPTPEYSPTPAPPESPTPEPTTPPSPPTGTASIALVGASAVIAAIMLIYFGRKKRSI